MPRKYLIPLVVLLAVLLLWAALGGFSRGVAVDAATVRVGPIREFIDEQAVTRLPQTHLVTMPFPGRVEAITLAEGAMVEKDQVVARIVPRDLDLDRQQGEAAVQRLNAALTENAYIEVEQTALAQTLRFVESMAKTVEAAQSRVQSGKARLEFAESELARVERLHQSGAVTPHEYERTKLEKIQAEIDFRQDRLVSAAMEAMQAATNLMPTMVRQYIQRKALTGDVLRQQKAEADVELLKVMENLERGSMRSPVTGVVLSRPVTNERFLPAGTTLLEIGRLEDLEVEADVLTLDVVAAKPGDAVEIYGPAIGKTPAQGTVSRIYPAGFTKVSSLGVEQQRVKVVVRFQPDDLARVRKERHLGVGYRVRVRIITGQKDQASIIPRSALFRSSEGGWQVFAVRNGRAVLADVTIGMMNDEIAEVVTGLEPDDQVIRTPETGLMAGQKVRVQRANHGN